MKGARRGVYLLYPAILLACAAVACAAVFSVGPKAPPNKGASPLEVKWERIPGLWGGSRHLEGIAVQPRESGDVVYAFFYEGLIYRSTDPGEWWEKVTDDPRLHPFGNLIAAGKGYRTLILSCAGYGNGKNKVFRSEDDGRTWVKCDLGDPPPEWARPVATDPGNPEVVYAGAKGAVYKSTDGGRTWKKHFQGLRPDASIGDIAVHASRPSVVYAGGGGFYRSGDGGATWEMREEGLPKYRPRGPLLRGQEPEPGPPHVVGIVLDKTDPDVVRVRLWPDGRVPQWYATSDGGCSWRRLEALWPRIVRDGSALLFSPSDASGATRSAVRGANWGRTGVINGLETPVVARVGPSRSRVLVGAGGTIYPRSNDILGRSTDDGVSWKPAMRGIDAGALDVRVIPSKPEVIVATTNTAIWSSWDGGKTWQAMAFESQPQEMDIYVLTALNSIKFHPTDPRVCYAPLWGQLYKSDYRGRTWHILWQPAKTQTLSSLQICRSQPSRMYMNQVMATTLRSDDGGRTWAETAGMLYSDRVSEGVDLVAHPVRPDTLYARKGLNRTDRLYRSTDAGESWAEIGVELQAGSKSLRMIGPLIHPKDPGRIYVLAKSWKHSGERAWELLVSTDGGRTWQRRPCVEEKDEGINVESLRYQSRLAPVPQEPGAVLAIVADSLLYSPDDGRTWHEILCPEQGKRLNAVAVDSRGTVFLATEDGLYRGRLPRGQ